MKISSAFFLIACFHATMAASQSFEPATKIKFTIVPSVVFSTGGFGYSYSLASDASSQQKIWLFDIQLDTQNADIRGIASPDGWTSGIAPRGAVDWGGIDPAKQINPGSALGGFGFVSDHLPEITTGFAQGYVDLPAAVDNVDESSPAQPSLAQNVVYVATLGPGTTASSDESALIDRLISLKHRAAALGWIGGGNFVEELDERLNRASTASGKGRNEEIRADLREFIEILEKRRRERRDRRGDDAGDGKRGEHGDDERFLNDNAYQLLKLNAQYALSRLPRRGKEHEEDSTHH